MRQRLPPLLLLLAPLLLAMGSGLARRAAAQELEISLRPVFGEEAVLADSLRYTLASGETVSFVRLSCLWSGFSLQKADGGGWVELPGACAWTDFASRRQRISLTNIPPGKYTALRFFCGPDPEANRSSPDKWPPDHPFNPNVNRLHWSWQGGYIFAAVEGLSRTADAGSPPQGYSWHFARDPNRTAITIPASFTLEKNGAIALHLDFDLKSWFGSISLQRDGTSTHSRDGDSIAAALRKNLPAAMRLRAVEAQEPPSAAATAAKPVAPLFLPEKYTPYPFRVAAGFPIPPLPRDNPLLAERVALGRRLFHEPLLSRDATISCASCHDAAFAFSDPRAASVGVAGRTGKRNAMALVNLAWKSSFFWDGRAPTLRQQALVPIQDHLEMDESLDRIAAKLSAHPDYQRLFALAFQPPQITSEKIGLALENYLFTLTSFDSPFDLAMRGGPALNAEESRGFQLFFTEYDPRTRQLGADCFHCHGGATFSDHLFHNNGLRPAEVEDPGLFAITKSESDRGKFATPTLRNIARTAPYMHDGRFKTLEEVIDHYTSGIHRSPTLDPNLAKHPPPGIPLSKEDKKALVAFLKTLTESPQEKGGGTKDDGRN